MGGCIHKRDEVITCIIKKQEQNSNESYKSKNKKYMSTAISSLDNHSKKYNKNKIPFPTLYSNDLSKILKIPDLRSNDNDINNLNSLREIIELLEYKYEEKKM